MMNAHRFRSQLSLGPARANCATAGRSGQRPLRQVPGNLRGRNYIRLQYSSFCRCDATLCAEGDEVIPAGGLGPLTIRCGWISVGRGLPVRWLWATPLLPDLQSRGLAPCTDRTRAICLGDAK